MPRVKRSVHARKKRRKVLDQAKGYWGLKSKSYRYAKEQVEHSLVYAYRDRKARKRTFRRLWIMRINAAARANDLSYNQLVADPAVDALVDEYRRDTPLRVVAGLHYLVLEGRASWESAREALVHDGDF